MRTCRQLACALAAAAVFSLIGASRADAQLGALLSPGPLAKAHSSLEGAANCEKCHERGNKVTAAKCLSCHAPVAQRIARRAGVHRHVKDECVSCHADHAGVAGELRPFDQTRFNHATEAGYPLLGKHGAVAGQCASCHKTRSFLTASTTCTTCHQDKHKGALGPTCERCHALEVTFASASKSFDHSHTNFALTGGHRTVVCAACHKTPDYRVAKFSACASCHVTPHTARVSPTCTSCHTTDNWKTKSFDHTRTAFPLIGKHLTADCAGCHKQPATKVKPPAATCATCHTDPHKGDFKQDCKACHTESGFTGAKFDHMASTGYALMDRHATVACRQCHTAVSPPGTARTRLSLDYKGLKTTCASCHTDPHGAELGSTCEPCHSARTFKVAAYTHAKALDLFTGQHAAVACRGCHLPAKTASAPAGRATAPGATAVASAAAPPAVPHFTGTPTACASCHRDPHLGQLAADCATCHSVNAVKFAADRFSHDRTKYPLAGKHKPLACAACHKPITQAFPAGNGTATQFAGLGTACASCHQDVHLGQVGATCDTCHTAASFKVMNYRHRQPPRDFFVGRHVSAECKACHAPVTRQFPAGRGTAINFTVATTCTGCHKDPHNGTLGPDCGRCHRPGPLSVALGQPPAQPRPSTTW